MKIEIAGISFTFSWVSVLLYLVLLTLLVMLGFWQLGRADEKKIFLAKQKLSVGKEIIKLSSVIDADSKSLRYRKAEITGHYDQGQQYLIDNQIVNGQAGYFVMTPFILDGMNKAVLVNRGWIILNKDRRVLPDLSVSTLKATLTGRINNFPVVGIRLTGAEIPTDGWPSVVQVVDSKVLSNKLGYTLYPFQVELDAAIPGGYLRDWKENTVMPPEQHVAYAVQWFGLAITLTILFFWFSSKKLNERST
ncbi:MAG: SURF1 family protein [Methylococcaceae bacterium]|nr:SURF1 family protein [Methylococcaceae bacterium]